MYSLTLKNGSATCGSLKELLRTEDYETAALVKEGVNRALIALKSTTSEVYVTRLVLSRANPNALPPKRSLFGVVCKLHKCRVDMLIQEKKHQRLRSICYYIMSTEYSMSNREIAHIFDRSEKSIQYNLETLKLNEVSGEVVEILRAMAKPNKNLTD